MEINCTTIQESKEYRPMQTKTETETINKSKKDKVEE